MNKGTPEGNSTSKGFRARGDCLFFEFLVIIIFRLNGFFIAFENLFYSVPKPVYLYRFFLRTVLKHHLPYERINQRKMP